MPGTPELRGGHRRDAGMNGGSAAIAAAAYVLWPSTMLTLALVLALQACPQRIVVTAPSVRSTTASLSLLGVRPPGPAAPFRARAGYGGFSANRHEGDGTTPIGAFAIGPTVYGLDPIRVCASPIDVSAAVTGGTGTRRRRRTTASGTSPAAPNRRSQAEAKRCGAPPSPTGSLRSSSTTPSPARPGRGSAIFLHDDLGHATNGCLSLPRGRLIPLLRLLRPGYDHHHCRISI